MEQKKRYVIGMLVANITDPFSNLAAKGAIAAAEQRDANLIIIPGKYICDTSYTNSDTTYEYQYNNLFRYANDKCLDAVCVCIGTIGYASSYEEKKEFMSRFGDLPTISVAAKLDGYDYVVFDNVQSVRDSVNYIIREQGVKKVACISGSTSNTDCAERLEGYKLALADNGIELDESLICFVNPSRMCKDDFAAFMKEHPDVGAVVCSNDDMCLAVYDVCSEMGLKVGKDLLVVGFDDMEFAEKLDPPLASVKASAEDLGYNAVLDAIDLIEGRKASRQSVPTRFIPRVSCGHIGRAVTDIDVFLSSDASDRLQKVMYFIYDGTDAAYDTYIAENLKRVFDVVDCIEQSGIMTHEMVLDVGDAVRKIMDYHKDYFAFIKNIQMTADALYNRLSLRIKETQSKANLEALYLGIYRMLSRDAGVQITRAGEASVDMLRRSNIIVRDTLMVKQGGGTVFADLLKRLPLLEVNSSYMYLLPKPVNYRPGDKPYDISRWRFVAYSKLYDTFKIDEDKRDIAFADLFRNKYMPTDRRYTLVMADLYSGEQQFGILLCELKAQFFEYLEFITYQFGAAVRIVSLINELERHMKELHHDNEELAGISRADELTGLLNRRGFLSEAEEAVRKGRESGKKAVMVFADLDYLKYINDRFGHNKGDFALKASAVLLEKIFGSDSIIGRTGGDEFNVLAMLGGEADIEQKILSRKQEYVDELNASSGKPYRIDLSMGIYEFCCSDIESLSDAVERADEKLYDVKRARKYDPYKNG